jgi:phenylacetate-CoA ligase
VHHMMAYVDAAEALARYSRRRNRAVRPLRSIMACAGTVTDDARNLLREVFEARIHNKYGSRDCADMACECPEGGVHIYSQQVVLEVIDNAGNPVPPGETGQLLVTLLGNRSFPLIRYDIGDRGALSVEMCRCGRPFPLLARVEGREVEFLYNSSGGYVTPAYVIHLIGVVHNQGVIRRFQLVQESMIHCRLLIEEEAEASPAALRKSLSDIERDLKLVFGAECRFDIERVDRIPETASGKFLYTINRMIPQG